MTLWHPHSLSKLSFCFINRRRRKKNDKSSRRINSTILNSSVNLSQGFISMENRADDASSTIVWQKSVCPSVFAPPRSQTFNVNRKSNHHHRYIANQSFIPFTKISTDNKSNGWHRLVIRNRRKVAKWSIKCSLLSSRESWYRDHGGTQN